MKKAFAALAVLMAVVTGFMFTGCDLFQNLIEEYALGDGEWGKYELTYTISSTDEKSSSTNVKLDCFVMYSDNTVTKKGIEYKILNPEYDKETNSGVDKVIVTKTIPAGLTIVVRPKTNGYSADDASIIAEFFKTTTDNLSANYAIKTFEKGESLNDKGLTVSSTTWKAGSAYLNYNGTIDTVSIPNVLGDATMYHNIEADGVSGFNWKTIAAMLLINQLTK